MRSASLALAAATLLIRVSFAHGQFLPNLAQYANGMNLAEFVQADVNNDGKVDIIGIRSPTASLPNFQIVVLLGDGKGRFGAPIVTHITGVDNSKNRPFVVGDFNGDGRLDFAVFAIDFVTGQPAVSVMFGNGDGTFGTGHETLVGSGGVPSTNVCAYTVGDYNGDGKLDIAYLNAGAGGIGVGGLVLLGKGDGTFSSPRVAPIPGPGC